LYSLVVVLGLSRGALLVLGVVSSNRMRHLLSRLSLRRLLWVRHLLPRKRMQPLHRVSNPPERGLLQSLLREPKCLFHRLV